jgi:hypothetical protein
MQITQPVNDARISSNSLKMLGQIDFPIIKGALYLSKPPQNVARCLFQ